MSKFRVLALSVIAVVVAGLVAAPPALAIRDTGWWGVTCSESGGWQVHTFIRVVWYASDNHRQVSEYTYIDSGPGTQQWTSASLGFWVEPAGVGWINWLTISSPDAGTYTYDETPPANPWDGAYWIGRARDYHGDPCDIQVFG